MLSVNDGQTLAAKATEKGLQLGTAPDTFLGGVHQLAQHLIEQGRIGRINSGTCFAQSPGMEM